MRPLLVERAAPDRSNYDDRVESKEYWKDMRFDFDASGNPEYIGKNMSATASTTDTGWVIWRYTFDGSGDISRIQGPLRGAWDSRTALAWS